MDCTREYGQNCVCREGGGEAYEKARIIQNARFDLKPDVICYCKDVPDVQDALSRARTKGMKVRVRAGGHHHEGMCSGGEGIMVIDVSGMNQVRFVPGTPPVVAAGPGAKNQAIYDLLWAQSPRHIFNGGGCGDVRIGGLAQGGGWGLYSRALGLTCDRVISFDIVLADGTYKQNVQFRGFNDKDFNLFWGVRGAGGGNFGIVTELRIATMELTAALWSFTAAWKEPKHRRAVIDRWRQKFPNDSDVRLTSFCRVSALDKDHTDPAILVSGFYMDGRDALEAKLRDLLGDTYGSASVSYEPVHKLSAHPQYQPGPPSLSSTCEGNPFPHKISSCFAPPDFGDDGVHAIVSILAAADHNPVNHARRYLSLHSMGGRVRYDDREPDRNRKSCFYYRDNPFMLQYQAWWDDPSVGDACMKWVAGFRTAMAPFTTGAFINFPDADLPAANQKERMRIYFRDNLSTLMSTKQTYDGGGLFDFPLGIPRS